MTKITPMQFPTPSSLPLSSSPLSFGWFPSMVHMVGMALASLPPMTGMLVVSLHEVCVLLHLFLCGIVMANKDGVHHHPNLTLTRSMLHRTNHLVPH